MSGFERALQQNPAPRQVGDVQLRSSPPVLVGETTPPPVGLGLPDVLRFGGLSAGIGALSVLLTSPGAAIAGWSLAFAAAISVALGVRLERVGRARRRFVLHFGEETLRVDVPGTPLRAPRQVTRHFDEVQDLYVLRREDGTCALYVDVSARHAGASLPLVLVDGVRGAEDEAALGRLWTLLRAAFGLTRASPPEG